MLKFRFNFSNLKKKMHNIRKNNLDKKFNKFPIFILSKDPPNMLRSFLSAKLFNADLVPGAIVKKFHKKSLLTIVFLFFLDSGAVLLWKFHHDAFSASSRDRNSVNQYFNEK